LQTFSQQHVVKIVGCDGDDMIIMDDSPPGGREEKIAVVGGGGGRKRKLSFVTKPFRRWLIVIYKQALALVRQAFKMVTDLEGRGGAADDLASDNVIRDLIDKTKIWLVDQIGKNFSSEKKPSRPLKRLNVAGGAGRKKARSVPVATDVDDDASPPPPPLPSVDDASPPSPSPPPPVVVGDDDDSGSV
jgi:hypothetical protein